MNQPMRLRAETYSGYKADERPLALWMGDRRLEVIAVTDRWCAPGSTWFRIRASDGDVYVLRHREVEDEWTLEAYRRGEGREPGERR